MGRGRCANCEREVQFNSEGECPLCHWWQGNNARRLKKGAGHDIHCPSCQGEQFKVNLGERKRDCDDDPLTLTCQSCGMNWRYLG